MSGSPKGTGPVPQYTHAHPVNILEQTSRFLALLLFPLLRALLSIFLSGGDLYLWLRGAWFDICILLLILGMGFAGWFRCVYRLEENGLRVRKGLAVARYRYLPYRKLSVLSVERPWYLIPFRAIRVRADTDGGTAALADFEMTIWSRELEPLCRMANAPFVRESEIKRVYLPRNFYIAVLSFVASNTLTGVLFISTFISGAGKVLGDQVEDLMMQQLTELSRLLAFGIPPAAAALAIVILGGWLVSFLLNLVRHMLFSATRQGGSLHIRSGLLTRREYWLSVRRVNLIELQQTLMTKLFGLYAAFIHCSGYGKGKDELSVLMPAAAEEELERNLELLMPEIPLCGPEIRPRLKFLTRFLIPPLGWILAVTLLWIGAFRMFKPINEMILYVGLMAEVPCVWYLLVKLVSFFHTGIGLSKNAYTFRYTYGYRIKTVAVPRERIVRVAVTQSLFQVMSGCCNVVVHTVSEGRKRHVIPNLDLRQALELLNLTDCYPPEQPGKQKGKAVSALFKGRGRRH
ncbi:MAG: PH domain-containing protein [Oscillospiraceae bacterium]|jgi:putative membrane protein|nr:PH domain-containing protein [Oscillospiraceae bacterium]